VPEREVMKSTSYRPSKAAVLAQLQALMAENQTDLHYIACLEWAAYAVQFDTALLWSRKRHVGH
jgi:hypothetical protein